MHTINYFNRTDSIISNTWGIYEAILIFDTVWIFFELVKFRPNKDEIKIEFLDFSTSYLWRIWAIRCISIIWIFELSTHFTIPSTLVIPWFGSRNGCFYSLTLWMVGISLDLFSLIKNKNLKNYNSYLYWVACIKKIDISNKFLDVDLF